ncbi:hypothetical protein [Desulfomarina sp.]
MYQSLLPVLKPLVFEGKSGVLEIVHKYDDRGFFYLNEGIIEQVETKKLQGRHAAAACVRWVNITTRFTEGGPGKYVPDPDVDTNEILSYLEKVHKNIAVINDKISDDNAIFQADFDRIGEVERLSAGDLKVAMLLDGERNIEQVMRKSGKSELAVLTHICRLMLAGVIEQKISKNILAPDEQNDLLVSLEKVLIELVGPAASILIEDSFEEIQSRPGALAKEDVQPLFSVLRKELDGKDRASFDAWSSSFLSGRLTN